MNLGFPAAELPLGISLRAMGLGAACAIYKSKVAVYHLLFYKWSASSIPAKNPTMKDMLRVPLPFPGSEGRFQHLTAANIDNLARKLLQFNESEWALIEDAFGYTLPDFKGDANSPRKATDPSRPGQFPPAQCHCQSVTRVLRSALQGIRTSGAPYLLSRRMTVCQFVSL